MSDIKESEEFKSLARLIGANARARRLALELTLEQAAERMSLDVAHLARIETGKLNPTVKTLLRLCQGLNFEVAELFKPSSLDSK